MKTGLHPIPGADGATHTTGAQCSDGGCVGDCSGGCPDVCPGVCSDDGQDDSHDAVGCGGEVGYEGTTPVDTASVGSSALSGPAPGDQVVEAIRRRAENLFDTRQLLCAEAVLHAVAEALGGPLSPDRAAALGTPFCQGMGGAGCTCGALSGAVAAVGLFRGRPERGAGGTKGRALARQMHDAFRADCGATCCRVLIRHVRHDKAAHFAQCRSLTGKGAVLAARALLAEGVRPSDGALSLPADTGLTLWRNRLRVLLRLPFRRRS
ncbi:putative redox-active protein [anaerobic digester metagenome]